MRQQTGITLTVDQAGFRVYQATDARLLAHEMLDRRGAYIIVIGRFIPGGRTAVTFSAGYIPTFPWRRFVLYDAVAAAIWASYAAGLGYFGGKTFENHPFLGLMVALGIAPRSGSLVEAVRHRRQRACGLRRPHADVE
jgi:membrane protein DedA with SNARE-associated domain